MSRHSEKRWRRRVAAETVRVWVKEFSGRKKQIMIIGVGMDLCGIDRISLMRGKESFLKRFFSERERNYIAEKGASSDATAAGLYAAKEAYVKAIGTGIIDEDLTVVEIIHTGQGQPQYRLSGWAAAEAERKGITSIYLSITHDNGTAAAVAVAEKKWTLKNCKLVLRNNIK